MTSTLPSSAISGVTLSELAQIGDSRGYVLHMLRCDSADFTQFGECYFSEVFPDSVKAWKLHRRQTQNLAVPIGRIRMILFDTRQLSVSQGVIEEFELGRPDLYFRLTIPYGIWYGFACVSQQPALLVNCSDMPHDSSESIHRPIDHPSMPCPTRFSLPNG